MHPTEKSNKVALGGEGNGAFLCKSFPDGLHMNS